MSGDTGPPSGAGSRPPGHGAGDGARGAEPTKPCGGLPAPSAGPSVGPFSIFTRGSYPSGTTYGIDCSERNHSPREPLEAPHAGHPARSSLLLAVELFAVQLER